jgi:hypothetical protein
VRFFFIFLCGIFLSVPPALAQYRSFEELFPYLDEAKCEKVFSDGGLFVSKKNTASLQLLPSALAESGFQQSVIERRPVFLIESLLVIPVEGGRPDLLTIYNACGRVRDLKGRQYRSFTRGRDIALFEDATRIQSERKLSAIPDPPAASSVPPQETMYLRLKDANFGNSYYRADISVDRRSLTYRLVNFKNLSYLFFPAIRENKFIAQLYIEPIAEGVLIYSLSGVDVSDFIASKIDIPSAFGKRLEVIIDWISEGMNYRRASPAVSDF